MSVGDLFMLVLHFVSARDSMSKSLFSPFPCSPYPADISYTYLREESDFRGKKNKKRNGATDGRTASECEYASIARVMWATGVKFHVFRATRRDGMFGVTSKSGSERKKSQEISRPKLKKKSGVVKRRHRETCPKKNNFLMCHQLFRGFTVPRVRRISLRLEFRENCKLQPQITLPFLTSWNLIPGLRRKSIRSSAK